MQKEGARGMMGNQSASLRDPLEERQRKKGRDREEKRVIQR